MTRKEEQLDLIPSKKGRGGARPGAGRKSSGIETKVMRVPARYQDTIKALVEFLDFHSNDTHHNGEFTSPPVQHRTLRSDYRQDVEFTLRTLKKPRG